MKRLAFFWNNLRVRMITMFVIFSALVVGGVSFLIRIQAEEALQTSVVNRLTNIALLKEAELNRWAKSNQTTLNALAQRPLVREYTAQLAAAQDPSSYLDVIDLILENHFDPTLQAEGGFQDLLLIRAEDGLILASTEPDLVGKFRESRDYFLQGLNGPYVGKPHYEMEVDRPVMHISTPVYGQDGKVTAVLSGHVDIDEMSGIMTQHREFTSSQETYLINQANLMITESRYEADAAHRIFVFSYGATRCVNGSSGSAYYTDYRDVPVIGVYRWLDDWEMCLLTEQDQADAFGLISSLTRSILGIGVSMTLLGAAGGVFFTRTITRPLKKLTRGAREIASGNLRYQVPLDSGDELGDLARSFNQMSSSLADSQEENQRMLEELQNLNQELEARVEDRTRDLKDAQLAALNMMEDARRAREKAEENEVRFRTLFDQSPISLWEEDYSALKTYLDELAADGITDLGAYFSDHPGDLSKCTTLIQVREINRRTLDIFEAESKHELIDRLEDTFLEATRLDFLEELLTLSKGEVTYTAENQRQTLKGKEIWVNYQIHIPPDYRDDWSRTLITVVDITEQKLAQKAILREKEYSERVINSIPGIFYVFNPQGEFQRWNNNFLEVSGYSEDEMAELHPVQLFQGEEQNLVAERIQEVFKSGESSVMANFVSKGGEKTPYFLTGVQAVIDGELLLIGTGVDISDRVAAEEALEKKARELARSNEDLEHFAYVASHDLQEPLRMVASYLQLLERRYGDTLEEDAREFMSYAVDGATRMKRLINDLLAYSRVGTRGGTFQETSLDEVLGKVHTNLIDQIEETNAVITHDGLPLVNADQTQMMQLFQNLISNAIKFRKEDEPPVIRIKAEKKDRTWQLSVSDNGIGFDPKFSDRLFILFQRLHPKEEYPGTGIGLAVSKRIVERHGGRIWVDSVKGEGTTFTFTLPEDQEQPIVLEDVLISHREGQRE